MKGESGKVNGVWWWSPWGRGVLGAEFYKMVAIVVCPLKTNAGVFLNVCIFVIICEIFFTNFTILDL